MMNNTDTEARFETAAHDVALALAPLNDLTSPDVGRDFHTPDVGRDFHTPDVVRDFHVPDVGRDFHTPDVGRDIHGLHVGRDFHGPDVGRGRPEGFVRHEYSPLLTPAHIDVTNRPIRYAKPKPFEFPTRKQMRNIAADRWMRQRFKAAKLTAFNELSSVHFSIDNRSVLEPSFHLGRAAIESIQLAFANASRCLRFNDKIVH